MQETGLKKPLSENSQIESAIEKFELLVKIQVMKIRK